MGKWESGMGLAVRFVGETDSEGPVVELVPNDEAQVERWRGVHVTNTRLCTRDLWIAVAVECRVEVCFRPACDIWGDPLPDHVGVYTNARRRVVREMWERYFGLTTNHL